MTSLWSRRISLSAIVSTFVLGLCACSTEPSGNGSDGENGGTIGAGGADNDTPSSGSTSSSSGGATSDGEAAVGGAESHTTVTDNRKCKLGGWIEEATTIAPDPACPDGYRVESTIHVEGLDAILTIAPGTVLKFDAETGITVSDLATIQAVGTKDAPIRFTGWQEAPGAWDGIFVTSESMKNEIAYAIVEYAGSSTSDNWGAVSLGDGDVASTLSLSNVQLQKNGYFGLSLASYAKLLKFENNEVLENGAGALRARAGSVHLFKGTGNRLEKNGGNNSVRIAPSTVNANVTWPNLSPSVYRVVDESNVGDQLEVVKHLTIEPGTVIEFSSGMGLNIQESNAGLSAIGTAESPIVFRGIDGSSWLGIGFAETSWTGNALENVRFENAYGAPENYEWTTIGNASPGLTSVAVGQLTGAAAYLRVKNVSFVGPNEATNDISVTDPAILVVEGVNSGAGTNGGLAIRNNSW